MLFRLIGKLVGAFLPDKFKSVFVGRCKHCGIRLPLDGLACPNCGTNRSDFYKRMGCGIFVIPGLLFLLLILVLVVTQALNIIMPNQPSSNTKEALHDSANAIDDSSDEVIDTPKFLEEATSRTSTSKDHSSGYMPSQELERSAAEPMDSADLSSGKGSKPKGGEHVLSSDSRLPISSYWSHNGSVMGLIVDGKLRTIVYVEVRDGLAESVKPGSVLFSGISNGKRFKGKASRFSKSLPPIDYEVEGPIMNEGSKVILLGQAPIRNSDGKIAKYAEDRLEFSFLRLAK